MTYLEMQLSTETATIQNIARHYELKIVASDEDEFRLTATKWNRVLIDIEGDFVFVLKEAELIFNRMTKIQCLDEDGVLWVIGSEYNMNLKARINMVMDAFCTANIIWIGGKFNLA